MERKKRKTVGTQVIKNRIVLLQFQKPSNSIDKCRTNRALQLNAMLTVFRSTIDGTNWHAWRTLCAAYRFRLDDAPLCSAQRRAPR